MRVKKRTISVSDGTKVVTVPTSAKFPTIEAKPKEPLPEPRFADMVSGGGSSAALRLGPIALSCSDSTRSTRTDDRFTAGDYVALIRTPYDPTNTTEVRYRNRVRNRPTAITCKCVDCAGSRKAVTECESFECPLWAFRLGGNPFRRRT